MSQKKIPPAVFWHLPPYGWEFLINFLHTYYTFISTLDCKFLFNYLQFWRSYAILSETTHRTFDISLELLVSWLTEQMTSLLTSCHMQHVCWHYKSSRSGMTCHRQRSTKLSTTYTNVWMCTFRPMVDILSILCELGSRNFVKVWDNWIKIFNLAYMATYNRCVKSDLKFSTVCQKMPENRRPQGRIFLTHTVQSRRTQKPNTIMQENQ